MKSNATDAHQPRWHFLRPVDALAVVFILLLSVITIAFASLVSDWVFLIPLNFASCAAIFSLSRRSEISSAKLSRFLHTWYPVPAIFLLFKEVYIIIQSLGRNDWDNLLIAADRAIFHTDPTVWLGKFSSPVLTEILQIAYVSYYFILLTVGIELYLRNEKGKFSYVLFTITYGLFLSYLGYLIFPAVGPRFTLHDFNSLNTVLPGAYFTNMLRDFLDAGESIPKNSFNPIALAQRDAFPSGHTQMTLISLYLAHRYWLKSRHVLTFFGTLLIISTVYLRYHYVIDIAGGVFFMLFTVWTAPKLFDWWRMKTMHMPELKEVQVATDETIPIGTQPVKE